jgi:hypothetical protein
VVPYVCRAQITTGAAAASFTATGYSIATDNSCREVSELVTKWLRHARYLTVGTHILSLIGA